MWLAQKFSHFLYFHTLKNEILHKWLFIVHTHRFVQTCSQSAANIVGIV